MLSSAVYDMIRATVTGLLLIAAAVAIFGLRLDLDPASIGVATVALVGCLALFTSLGVAVAAFTIVFKRGTMLLALVVTALALLGGVYFPIEVLPDPHRVGGQRASVHLGSRCVPGVPARGSRGPGAAGGAVRLRDAPAAPVACWYSRLR